MRLSRLAPPSGRPPPDFGLAQVNIVLLLVLFFLVVGTIVETDELNVDLPETLDLPLDRLPRPLLLIDRSGGWSLDGAPVTSESLPSVLEASDVPGPIHILMARDMPASLMMQAMQAAAPSGRAVMLVTLKLEPESEG